MHPDYREPHPMSDRDYRDEAANERRAMTLEERALQAGIDAWRSAIAAGETDAHAQAECLTAEAEVFAEAERADTLAARDWYP